MNIAFKAVLLSSVIASFAAPSIADAQVELRLGPGGVEVQNHDRDRYDDRYYERGPRRRCDPRDALDNARDAGLRRAQIIRETPRSITVQGFTRSGRPDRMSFANVRDAPRSERASSEARPCTYRRQMPSCEIGWV